MEHLQDLALFVRIAQAQSLSEVARAAGLSSGAVSKQLSRLEAELGVQLVKRSTRHLHLTQEGIQYAAQCRQVLSQLERAREEVRMSGELVGEIRITASLPFSRRHLAPLLAEFGMRHPRVRIHLVSSDALVSLVGGGFDLAIRQAALVDSSLVARLLVGDRRIACASPDYLARHGWPQTPGDLVNHRCLLPGDPPINLWRFVDRDGGSVTVNVGSGMFQTNDGEVAHAATLAGAGIALKSIWDVADDLVSGRLVDVLPDCHSPAAPIQAVYVRGQTVVSGRVRALIDFLAERLQCSPIRHRLESRFAVSV
ncbi:LysR family transcriptional regulator [Frateuria aurantia]|uniref:Transcriptional regulator n=1 Tax=Frateuria aurantia (strain ATCC 33424 / DSM 6220 / KCTC 2777 / LMG 1558 / NBRC 3245 / NCIMB 13370) TaxID=767434 RepID=H8L1Q3_FRAAD|nr:LysR family transcriptional regulator [Frateuria aurantia]AFC85413.1 transcriptional regulator [Frateuria aurantia DSM 6220]